MIRRGVLSQKWRDNTKLIGFETPAWNGTSLTAPLEITRDHFISALFPRYTSSRINESFFSVLL